MEKLMKRILKVKSYGKLTQELAQLAGELRTRKAVRMGKALDRLEAITELLISGHSWEDAHENPRVRVG